MSKGYRLGYMILHSGAHYLRAAIESMKTQVDQILILYSEHPSQGYGTDLECPDNRDLLRNIVEPYRKKIIWVDGNWGNEGDHTNAVYMFADKFEWLIRFDADEVFPDGMVDEMIKQAEKTQSRNFQFPFMHFWRSFNEVCRDAQFPYRMIHNTNNVDGDSILDSCDGKYVVHHMGYAIPNKYMIYKWEITGHKSELKPEWFSDIWYGGGQEDLHPVSRGLWPKSEKFDKNLMPKSLKEHPYFHLKRIS